MCRYWASILISLVFLFQDSRAGQNAWKGSVTVENGVTVIKNPSTPVFQDEVVEIKEDFVIKTSGAYGEYYFRRPFQLLLDEKCFLYVLDTEDSNVKVFNEAGRYVRSIGKKGIGPGELDNPHSFDLMPDEIVISCANRQFSFFGRDGKFRKMMHSDFSLGSLRFDSQGNIYSTVEVFEADRPRNELRKFDPGLHYLRTILTYDWTRIICCYTGAGVFFALTKDDRLVYGQPKTYQLNILNRDGKLIRRVLKSHRPVKIPPDELDDLKKRLRVPPEYLSWPEYYPPLGAIWIDEEGRIIVNTHARLTGDKAGTFDVFSPDGKFLATFKMRHFYHCLWANKRLYAVDEDEDGFPIIRVFRVNWKAGLAIGDADH